MPKKVYFSPERRMRPGASSETIAHGRSFASDMGFTVVAPRTANPMTYYLRLFRTWMTSDVFLAMYPYFSSPMAKSNRTRSIDRWLIPFLGGLRSRTKSILYVVDFPLEQIFTPEDEAQVDRTATQLEGTLFTEMDALIVFNRKMRDSIVQKYGVDGRKIVEFEILDYGLDFEPPATRKLKQDRTIAYTGGSVRKDFVLSWLKDIPKSPHVKWEFFGSDGDWIKSFGRDDMMAHGFLEARRMAEAMASRVDFGIISSKVDAKLDNYHNFGSTSKIGSYLTAGVPLLVPTRYSYICELVKKYKVGWTFDSPQELPSMVGNITPAEYDRVRGHALELGSKLRHGYFFKKAVNEALAMLGLAQGT